MMYEDLVLKLRAWENAGESNCRVFGQAADAIEALTKGYRQLQSIRHEQIKMIGYQNMANSYLDILRVMVICL